MLSGPALDRPLVIATDERGRYEFRDLPPGRYTVAADRAGYLRVAFGARRIEGAGRALVVAESATVDNIDFALPRMSTISGRVVDELGEPIDHAMVSALRTRFSNAGPQLSKTAIGQTDATGWYRIVNLPPGDYWIQASTSETWTLDRDGRPETLSYTPMYYPNAFRAEDARPVTVGTGQDMQDMDVSLTPSHPVSIAGHVSSALGRAIHRTTVYLSSAFITSSQGSLGGMTTMVASGPVADDGSFLLPNVPPGSYRLQVRIPADDGGPAEIASVPVAAFDADILDVAVNASVGEQLQGLVETDSRSVPLPTNGLRVAALPADQLLFPRASGTNGGEVNSDGSFTLTGLFAPYFVRVNGLPKGWALKAFMLGDRDFADSAVRQQLDRQVRARVVVTNRLATISGDVLDGAGKPAADYTVVAFSDRAGQADDAERHVRTASPDQHQRFELRDLLPGQYWVIAVDEVEPGRWLDPLFRDELRLGATIVTLTENTSKSITLRLAER